MAPRDDRSRKKSGFTITNIREGIWIIIILILWYSAHTAHWQLAQQSQKYEYEIQELQRLVAATQDHSKSLLSTHCNVTAIANVLASIAPNHQTNNHLRATSHKNQHTNSGLVDRLYSLEESAADQLQHLEERMFSMSGSSPPPRPIITVPPNPPLVSAANIKTSLDVPLVVVPPTSPSHMGAKQASLEWNKRKREGLNDENREWLLFGIPTVPRVNNEDHLIRVLTSIFDQLPVDESDDFYGRVKVLVMDASHTTHSVFEDAKKKWGDGSGSPHSQHVEFFQEPTFTKDVGGYKGSSANKPGEKVRRQTRNIASVLRHAAYRGRYFMFLEDDMLMCPQAIQSSIYLIDRVTSYSPDWFAVRSSFGMNGIFMQSKDIDTFGDYLVQHQARRPPDHLVVEYYAGEIPQSAKIKQNRPHFGFRYNLCDHLGKKSTLRGEQAKQMPVCYEELIFPAVFNVESFKPKECPLDDLWPCPKQPKEPRLSGLPEAVLPPSHPSKVGKRKHH